MKVSIISCALLLILGSLSSSRYAEASSDYHALKSVGDFIKSLSSPASPTASDHVVTSDHSHVGSILAIPATVVHYFSNQPSAATLAPATSVNEHHVVGDYTQVVSSRSDPHASVEGPATSGVAGKCECASSDIASVSQTKWNNELTETLMDSVKAVQELDDALSQIQSVSLQATSQVVAPTTNVAYSPEQPFEFRSVDPVIQSPSIEPVKSDVLTSVDSKNMVEQNRKSKTLGSILSPNTIARMQAAVHPVSNHGVPDEDYVSAERELKSIQVDLNRIIDSLDSNGHRFHSAMFKTLRAYVGSVERRIQVQLTGSSPQRIQGVTQIIVGLKKKITDALLKLKLKLTLKPIQSFTTNAAVLTVKPIEARSDPNLTKSKEVVVTPIVPEQQQSQQEPQQH